MKSLTAASVALLATTALAQAGGVERSSQSVGILFQDGNYAELSFSRADADVSGTWSVGGVDTGDMAPGYNNFAARVRTQLSDDWAMALVFENHIGADASYPTGTGFALQGSSAAIDGSSLTAMFGYSLNDNVTVYGGPRLSMAKGVASLAGGYTLSTETANALGVMVGAAYEIPEIALRVSATYNSAYTYEFNSTELGAVPGTFETEIPQSFHIEAQSGIAPGTLAFGSVRWVDWSEFDITPPTYTSGALAPAVPAGSSLVDFTDDSITYTLGVGRQFSDNFSGAISFSYEDSKGGTGANLAPTDGNITMTLGGRYSMANGVNVSGGVTYGRLGDTTTEPGGGTTADFSGNTVVGAGMTIGMSF